MLREAGYEIVPSVSRRMCALSTPALSPMWRIKNPGRCLHRARAKNPDAVVVAAGCYVQAAAQKLQQDGAVDIIIGNNRKKELIEILEAYFQEHGLLAEKEAAESYVTDIGKEQDYEELHISQVAEHTRAFIKVQDGCNQFCSYCIIPYTRGRVRSRRPEAVEEEVRELAKKGYGEVVLTGIHLSSYGIDFLRKEGGEADWVEKDLGRPGAPLLDLIRRDSSDS